MAAQTNGWVRLGAGNYDTYDHWRSYIMSHGIDVDYSYGNQCYDMPALLWHQYGLFLMTRPQGNGSVYMCWTISKNYNARSPFIAVEGVQNIRRGDCIIFNKSSWSRNGHIGFADADYSGRVYQNGAWRIPLIAQNQGQGTSWGTPSNRVNQNLSSFLGIFRNTKWTESPTPPTPPGPTPAMVYNKDKYNWVLFNNKRKARNG